ncbi:MAG: phosphate ABC transporter permease PstA [Firmicutes bacterium]|nr:phosphate ABC transporter permease PstA [Bacillota bacterium]
MKEKLLTRFRNYRRHPFSLFLFIATSLAALITFCVLAFLVAYILINGIPHLQPSLFEWKYTTDNQSVVPAMINTISITVLSLLIAVPLGIASAIYLTEYANKKSPVVTVISMTAETLSGIPSIVYGLFGNLFFLTALGWGYSLLSGAFTLAIMILPLVMRTTQEALISVPVSYREGSFGLGAGKLRTIFRVVLPSAVPGILSGVILSVGRIVGETAALIFTSGSVAKLATGIFSGGRTLAVHMYVLSGEGLYFDQAYATAVVLLVIVLIINMISNTIAKRLTRSQHED